MQLQISKPSEMGNSFSFFDCRDSRIDDLLAHDARLKTLEIENQVLRAQIAKLTGVPEIDFEPGSEVEMTEINLTS